MSILQGCPNYHQIEDANIICLPSKLRRKVIRGSSLLNFILLKPVILRTTRRLDYQLSSRLHWRKGNIVMQVACGWTYYQSKPLTSSDGRLYYTWGNRIRWVLRSWLWIGVLHAIYCYETLIGYKLVVLLSSMNSHSVILVESKRSEEVKKTKARTINDETCSDVVFLVTVSKLTKVITTSPYEDFDNILLGLQRNENTFLLIVGKYTLIR